VEIGPVNVMAVADELRQGGTSALVAYLQERGIQLEPVLTDEEVERVERTFAFRFPPDLRALLQMALPAGQGFPDWRNGPREVLQERLDWPLEGMCFDIEHNSFWLAEWGPKPTELTAALDIARAAVAAAPTLILIFGHRYIPDEPVLAGNPVFSVHQTDIIYYGWDLTHYLADEFSGPQSPVPAPVTRPIRFWDKIATW
jgi:hypothetical protein